MKTPDGTVYRIRYGYKYNKNGDVLKDRYSQRRSKNCLVTIQKEQTVYFGIARCKLSVDNFRKKEGRELALTRALASIDNYEGTHNHASRGSFYLDDLGQLGYCSVKYVRSLLKHFESLEQ